MKYAKFIAIMLMVYSFNNIYTMTTQEKLNQTLAGLAKSGDPASKAAQIIVNALKDIDVDVTEKTEKIQMFLDDLELKWARLRAALEFKFSSEPASS